MSHRSDHTGAGRDEAPDDAAAIAAVVAAAFEQKTGVEPAEVALVADLRDAGALGLSLVAEAPAGGVIGPLAFRPGPVEGEGAHRLPRPAPPAALPHCQVGGLHSAPGGAGPPRARA